MQSLENITSFREDNFLHIERSPYHSVDCLSTDVTRALYTWWSSFHDRRPMRSNLDIVNLPHLAPHIYLIEVTSPSTFMYRLCGEVVGDLIGRHYRLVEMSPTSEVLEDRLLSDYLITLLDLKGPCRCRGSLRQSDNSTIIFESTDLPLFDEAGNITHFVGVMCEMKR